jgi:hypothetical protein
MNQTAQELDQVYTHLAQSVNAAAPQGELFLAMLSLKVLSESSAQAAIKTIDEVLALLKASETSAGRGY